MPAAGNGWGRESTFPDGQCRDRPSIGGRWRKRYLRAKAGETLLHPEIGGKFIFPRSEGHREDIGFLPAVRLRIAMGSRFLKKQRAVFYEGSDRCAEAYKRGVRR